MGLAVEPRESGTDPQLVPPRVSVAEHSRTRRRILGTIGLLAALFLQFSLAAVSVFLTDAHPVEVAYIAGRLALADLPVLLVGLVGCLVGSPTGLRLAKVCAAIYYLLVLGIGVGWVLAGEGLGLLVGCWVYGIPGLLLLAGIRAMRPATAR
jgi:hypothetical protein